MTARTVRVMSDYELRRYIEADEVKLRALGHTRESLRTNHWLLTGELL